MYRRWTQNLWAAIAIIFYLGLLVRLFFIQIINGEANGVIAHHQSQTIVKLYSERGGIYDRNFNQLAFDIARFSFGVNPTQLVEKRKIARQFARVTGNNISYYLNLLKKKRFVWLARGVDLQTSKKIQFAKGNPVAKIKETGRFYPYDRAAAHILGFTNIDNAGLAGIEKKYNHLLEGKQGFKKVFIDARRKLVPTIGEPEKAPVSGKSLVLTLNIDYQLIAEEELRKGIEKYGAKSGMVVMLDPSTAEVLAMVSYPSFNPNNYSSYSRAERRNRALVDPYEPGSTFKLVTAAAALQEGIFKPTDKIFCENGKKMFSGGYITDHKPYGTLTVKGVFVHSSNIGVAKMAIKIGKQRIYNYGRAFGFGMPSGIDLLGEDRGKFTNYMKWSKSDLARFPIGYGVLVTGLQLANAYAVVANGGYLLKPRILHDVFSDVYKNTLSKTRPDTIRRVLYPKTVHQLKNILQAVVESGTGKPAGIEGVAIAGKTGTTKKYDSVLKRYSKRKYIASFVGFTPVNKPKLVCLVMVDEPQSRYKYGSQSAAPIFRNIIRRVLDTGVEPRQTRPSYVKNHRKIRVPDVTELNYYQAKEILTNLAFQVRSEGSGGYVVSQNPKPGNLLDSDEVIMLNLSGEIAKNTRREKVPNVVGKSIRDAIQILTQAGYDPVLSGSGYVIKQQPKANSRAKDFKCKIVCQPMSG
ncbi:MAG TPA: PASTA domain-containing protein [Bacteroidetes bacterium]|nr:PASTA domain-containing protein [Bacteroidota bacterium]